MPGFDISLTTDEIDALIKAASIGLDNLARKLKSLPDSHPVRRSVGEDYRNLSAALDALRDVQEEALLS